MTSGSEYLVINGGVVYEGTDYNLWALNPVPPIIPEYNHNNSIFREDYCGDHSRIRKGRFYTSNNAGDKVWQDKSVSHEPCGIKNSSIPDFHPEKVYRIDHTKSLKINAEIKLGSNDYYTIWEIIEIEKNIFGQDVFTLRNKSTLL